MSNGMFAQVHYLGLTLGMGRVDALSRIFAHVFAIQALIGFIYALHFKDRSQHVSAYLYVAGGIRVRFRRGRLTLFIFWELMSMASTMLVWLIARHASTPAGFRYFLFHILGGLFLLWAECLSATRRRELRL